MHHRSHRVPAGLLLGALAADLLMGLSNEWDLPLAVLSIALLGALAYVRRDMLIARPAGGTRHRDYLLTASPAVIYSTAAHGDYATTYVTSNLEAMTGYRAEQALSDSKFWLKHLHPEDRERVVGEFENIFRDDETVLEYRVRTRHGHYIWVHDVARLIRDARGQAEEIIGSWTDISERKCVELRLGDQQRALREARDEALQAARAKAAFLANTSHEIRTPLNGVLGMLELLASTDLGRQQQEFVAIARESAQGLLAVVNDILDISKLDAGKLVLECVDVDVQCLAESVASMFAERAARKKLELICITPPDLPAKVRTDPTRLRQVLVNLLGNAIKFTDEGEVIFEVSALYDTDREVELRFEVRDTGIGVQRNQVDRLFTPFTQADSSTTRRNGGTGLGLAISKQLVELLGGEIGVDSVVGRGSCFWIMLRLTKGSEAPPTEGAPQPRGHFVLAVDDNATHREVLAKWFEHAGLKHCCLASGASCLQRLEQLAAVSRLPDVIVMDLHMPGMDGVELARRLEALPSCNAIPRILLSTLAVQAEAVPDLFEGLLSKPLRRADLIDAIGRALDGGRAPHVSLPRAVLPAFPGKRALVMEDNVINQKVAACLLRLYGIDVAIAGDGAEGLQRLAREDFDLVFMDCQMPVMDGFAAVRLLRAREANNGTPRVTVVALTAHAMPGAREACLAAGMDDYLTKPVDRRNLEGMLVHWLGDGPAPLPGPATAQDSAPVAALFDIDTLEALGSLLQADLPEVLETFLKESRSLMASQRRAHAIGRTIDVERAAHTLKSISAQLGAEGLAELARQVECAAKAGNVRALDRLLPQSAESLQAVTEFLKHLLEDGGERVPARLRALI